ncbi:MmgE/PrpD family protein [Amycolatopsis endophytica]|uniref:2-methylcitrate dehydratase PrpD n=1 Tax=Amycolatopsis endophytica TaxID=860233 RepID=A0A853BAG3_9PSEU|nr:MmgE/PrpD family protein [Amycolatopsis endophytica]NYI91697.1 2-methylcitrate dehydratase PrpD [Amycolatopsis endophytica]
MTAPAPERLSFRLAETLTSLKPGDLPADVLDAAAVSLVDQVGVALGGAGLGEGCGAFADLARCEGGTPQSTLLGFGGRVPAAAAASVNGALAHALDYEDSVDGLPVHPHAQVVPAALALAEAHDLDGAALLASIAVGCDLTCRLAAATGTELAGHGWYPPPLAGALGATVASAHLLALGPGHTVDALSLVLMQMGAPGEIKYSPRSLVRGIRDGFGANAAVRAVQLAAAGIRGFDAPLEGRAGFFATHVSGQYRPEALLDGLGETFAGPRVSYKPWPSCRGTHSFLEAALDLRDEAVPAGIEAIDLAGAPVNVMLAEPPEAKRAPASAIDAKFSLPFTVATAFVDGRVDLGSFTSLERSEVLELARRVTFTADPAWDVPDRMTSARMTVRLRDGRVLHRRIDVPLGNPSRPLSDDALRAKFAACARHAPQPPPDPAQLAADLRGIAREPSVRAVLGRHLPEETRCPSN